MLGRNSDQVLFCRKKRRSRTDEDNFCWLQPSQFDDEMRMIFSSAIVVVEEMCRNQRKPFWHVVNAVQLSTCDLCTKVPRRVLFFFFFCFEKRQFGFPYYETIVLIV